MNGRISSAAIRNRPGAILPLELDGPAREDAGSRGAASMTAFPFVFGLTPRQHDLAESFRHGHDCPEGGDRTPENFRFTFMPASMVISAFVRCDRCGQSADITDMDSLRRQYLPDHAPRPAPR